MPNLFSGNSKSSTDTTAPDERIAAQDQAIVLRDGAAIVESGGLSFSDVSGSNLKLAPDLAGSANARLGSTEIGENSPVTITTADPELLLSALDKISDLAGAQSEGLQQFAAQSEAAQAEQVGTLLGALGELNKETDEETKRQRTVLYVVFGVFALLGFVFRKKLFS